MTHRNMMIHKKEPLPDGTKYPYGLVEIFIWRPSEEVEGQRNGTRFSSCEKGWRNNRNLLDVRTQIEENETWSWAGFSVNDFNSGYLIRQDSTPSEIKNIIERLWKWLEENQ